MKSEGVGDIVWYSYSFLRVCEKGKREKLLLTVLRREEPCNVQLIWMWLGRLRDSIASFHNDEVRVSTALVQWFYSIFLHSPAGELATL